MIDGEASAASEYGGSSSSPSEDVLLTILDRALRGADNATDRKKDILYLIYLGVLGFCCLSPCFYYLRLHMWQRYFFRRMQEQERSSLALAVARSAQATQHEQPSDCDERVREERRARILQLMEPVRMVRRSIFLAIIALQPQPVMKNLRMQLSDASSGITVCTFAHNKAFYLHFRLSKKNTSEIFRQRKRTLSSPSQGYMQKKMVPMEKN